MRHLLTTIRPTADEGSEVKVRANFGVHRTRSARIVQFMGEFHYRLDLATEGSRILRKRVTLGLNSLYAQGRLTSIL